MESTEKRFEPVKYDVSIHAVSGGFNVVVTEDDDETIFMRPSLQSAQQLVDCLKPDVWAGDPVPWSVFYPRKMSDAA
jgi:hypothetical protein